MGNRVIESWIMDHESQADSLKNLFSFKKRKTKTISV